MIKRNWNAYPDEFKQFQIKLTDGSLLSIDYKEKIKITDVMSKSNPPYLLRLSTGELFAPRSVVSIKYDEQYMMENMMTKFPIDSDRLEKLKEWGVI